MKKLFKITSLLGASNLVILFCGVIKNKIIAVLLGTNGMGVISQVSSFLSLLTGISTFGVQQGVIKFIAEERDEYKLHKILKISLCFVFSISVVLFLIVLIFRTRITELLFSVSGFEYALFSTALSAPFVSLGVILLFYFKGRKNINVIFKVNMISSLSGLLIGIVLIEYFKVIGAVVQIGITASLIFILSLFYLSREKKKNKVKLNLDDFRILKGIVKYGSVISLAYIFSILSLVIVKSLIIRFLGFHSNGIYQSILIISGMLISFPQETFWSYYFPTVCENKDLNFRKKEFENFAYFLISVATPLVIIVFLTGRFLIQIFLSNQFLGASDFLNIRLLGDIFLIFSWPIDAIFLADQRYKYILAFGFIPNLILVVLSFLLVKAFALSGIFYAYLFSMVVFFIIHLLTFKRKYPKLFYGAKLFKKMGISITSILLSAILINGVYSKYFVIPIILCWIIAAFNSNSLRRRRVAL